MTEYLGGLLHLCSKVRALRHGLALHGAALKAGRLANVVLSNHVLNMYAKCGGIALAHQLFDEMPERNLVSWAALISGYDQAGELFIAIDLYSRLRLALLPNEFVFGSVISACASLSCLPLGQQVHAQSLKLGCASISFVSNALISCYMKCGSCDDAFAIFSALLTPNSVSYNALIAGFVQNQRPARGLQTFQLMRQSGLIPDRFSYAGVLEACTIVMDIQEGLQLHCQTIKFRLDAAPFVGNVIIAMYSKFGLMDEAEKVFRSIRGKDVISWNTIITAYAQHADYVKSLDVLRELREENFLQPDDFTFAGALAACTGIASMHHGKQIHAFLVRTKLNWDAAVKNALLNMYAKCGCIAYAYSIFKQMSHPNLVSWNSIIAGFGNHGLGEKALYLFGKMKESGLKPDSLTFIALLIACNHAGLVDEGESLFNCMEEVYGVRPSLEHFSCLIDILGRAGRLAEAERCMRKFHFENNPVVVGSLLSACWLHGEGGVGERLGEQLLKLQPISTSPFVLLSNLYASDSMWSDVAEVRKMLKGSGLRKEPGYSIIEVQGKVEKFRIGDCSHGRIDEIRDVLRLLCLTEDELLT
uniref:Uncharacterized protein n=1 Tax=Opuntia streptacantha TaxID=393608 RepID=A0A7C9A4F8_OPUST